MFHLGEKKRKKEQKLSKSPSGSELRRRLMAGK